MSTTIGETPWRGACEISGPVIWKAPSPHSTIGRFPVPICAPIAPYTATRRRVREMVEANGGFVEIHVATPLEVCESRDRKGLYAKARAGTLKEFTGISDPYEEPVNPEMRIDTRNLSPDLAAHRILVKLESLGYVR